jgi:hypothetical protein
MRFRRFVLAVSLTAAVGTIVGCHRKPTRELEDARIALAAAQKAQAPLYAPSSFQDATQAFEDANYLVRKHRYKEAGLIARDAASKAQSATRLAAENKQKVLQAVRAEIEDTRRKLVDADSEIAIARAHHLDDKQIALFETDLLGARTKLDEAQKRLETERIPEAKKWSSDAQVDADLLLREIRFALARYPIVHSRNAIPLPGE